MEMEVEINDEEEHFEDFTTASDWEMFTANLEHLFTEWQAKPLDQSNVNQNWLTLSDKLLFAEFPFKVSYFKEVSSSSSSDMSYSLTSANMTDSIMKPVSSSETQLPPYLQLITENIKEFPPKIIPHTISELFNLKEFSVITPTGVEIVRSESKLKVLMSSVCIALNNTNSNFPVFIQYHHWNQNYFCGIAESSAIRTSFQMIHLKHVAKQYNFLSGVLDILKSKIGMNLSVPIAISAHLFHEMNVWHDDYTFETEYTDAIEVLKKSKQSTTEAAEVVLDSSFSWSEYYAFTHLLPFGCSDDPFHSLSFVVGWPSLTEDVVVDTATYSCLDPEEAPEWYFSLKPQTQLDFRLEERLENFWKLQSEMKSVEEILGKNLGKGQNKNNEYQYMSALDRIALGSSPIPGINRVITNVNRAQKQLLFSPQVYTDLAPIEQAEMDVILFYLFPDASRLAKYPYPKSFDKLPEFEKQDLQSFTEGLQNVKSAPMGSLVWRLGIILSHYASTAKCGGVAHVWGELILELRYRYENSIIISGLELGIPNSGTCLLNQKLQMLNCCIEKKLIREKKAMESLDGTQSQMEVDEGSEDEEFFDCEDSMPTSSNVPEEMIGHLQKPSGRLKKCGRLRLLKTGEPLFIPITQDAAPLTEDGFEEQTKLLVELGDDEQGTEQRAKLMSASLASDMQSFKAANPGCILEDFVRWYSPRDWIESDETDEFGNQRGELSIRMKMPGNLWFEVWSSAAAVPARRQKRLFDDTKEAENILSWMSSRSPHDISLLIFPCLAHAATLKILEEADKLRVSCKVPSTILHHLIQLTRSLGADCLTLRTQSSQSGSLDPVKSSSTEAFSNKYDSNAYKIGLLSSLSQVEREICQILSFQQKFPEFNLQEILKEERGDLIPPPYLHPHYIKIEGCTSSPLGKKIRDIFQKEVAISDETEATNDFKFKEPIKKVFVLKYVPSKNVSNETPLPQRMSCCLKKEDFKVAGTFSVKTDLC